MDRTVPGKAGRELMIKRIEFLAVLLIGVMLGTVIGALLP